MLDRDIEDFIEKTIAEKESTDLASLMKGYKLCAQSEGKSTSYINLITACIGLLTRYLDANSLPTNVSRINAQHIRGFVVHIQSVNRFADHPFARPQEGRLSGHTINTYMRSLRAFWSWLESEEIIGDNPFSHLRIPRAPIKVIPTFSEEQYRALLAQVDIASPQGYRNYTILLLLLDTMIRVSELTSCRMEDLNLEGRVIKVWGKGSKERIVPFAKTAQRSLWKYVSFHRQDMLFLTADGRPLTKNRVEAIIKYYGRKAGIVGVRVSPHTFRHTGAVNFLRNDGDIFTLQRIMGHASLEVLRGYINLSQCDVNTVHSKASPLDNLGLKAPSIRHLKGKRSRRDRDS